MAVNERSIRRDASSAFNDISICTLDNRHSSNNTTLTHSQTNQLNPSYLPHPQCGSPRSSPLSLASPPLRWPALTTRLPRPRPPFTCANMLGLEDCADTSALLWTRAVRPFFVSLASQYDFISLFTNNLRRERSCGSQSQTLSRSTQSGSWRMPLLRVSSS